MLQRGNADYDVLRHGTQSVPVWAPTETVGAIIFTKDNG